MQTEAKELKLQNSNNRLACDAFLQIGLAPAEPLIEADFNKLYKCNNDGKEFYFKLVDLMKLEFKNIGGIITLPSTGLEAHEWRKQWKERYPDTTDNTMLCVYYYKKCKRT